MTIQQQIHMLSPLKCLFVDKMKLLPHFQYQFPKQRRKNKQQRLFANITQERQKIMRMIELLGGQRMLFEF